jgi:hypothetical protein
MNTLELGEGYALKPASVLDIPFIFDLMMNGSELYVFGNLYLSGTGAVRLLAAISLGVVIGLISRNSSERWLILSLKGADIGFVKVTEVVEARATTLISLFAIIPARRNLGHGSRVMRLFAGAQPAGATLLVFCNKQARVMQHTLKKLHFVRNRHSGPLEEYSLTKPCQVDAGKANGLPLLNLKTGP